MAKVTGLGGLFYKVSDTERTARWYRETLDLGGDWGIMFPFKGEPDGFSLLTPSRRRPTISRRAKPPS
jgi:hypothetical protein